MIQIVEVIDGSGILALIEVHLPKINKKETMSLEDVEDFQDLMRWNIAQNRDRLSEKEHILSHQDDCSKESQKVAEIIKECFSTLLPSLEPELLKDLFHRLMDFILNSSPDNFPGAVHETFPVAIPYLHTHWLHFLTSSQIISCPNQNVPSVIKWFGLIRKNYPLKCCQRQSEGSKIKPPHGVIIWPIRLPSIFTTCQKCQCAKLKNTSVATRLMNTLLKTSDAELSQPNSNCFTFYSQQTSRYHLNLVLAKCFDTVDQDLINTIWRTCLTKMGSVENQYHKQIHREKADSSDSSSSSSRRKKK